MITIVVIDEHVLMLWTKHVFIYCKKKYMTVKEL